LSSGTGLDNELSFTRPGHGPFPFGLGAVDENGNPRLVELHGLGFSFVGKWKNLPKLMEFTVSWGFQRIGATSSCSYHKVVWSGLKSNRRYPFHL